MHSDQPQETELTKELVLKAFRSGLSERNLINRLFKDQLEGTISFPESEGIIWELHGNANDQYLLTTSEKWLKKEDFENSDFECSVTPFIEKSQDE